MKYLLYIGLLVTTAIIISSAAVLIICIKACRQPRPKPKNKFSLINKLFAQKGDEPFDGNPDEILKNKNNK